MGASITSKGMTTVAPPSRVMFIRCDSWEYRDSSNFNSFFTKAAFPSATLESKHDWSDRVFMTRNGDKVWRLETVLLADRSAAFRGQICGSQNQRIAAEAWEVVKDNAGKWWWEPIRRAALQFAGVSKDIIDIPLRPEHSVPHVITYISRQGGRRSLIPADHKELVAALDGLAKRRGWKFNHVRAQEIEKEQQLALIAGTTVCPLPTAHCVQVGLKPKAGPHRGPRERPNTPGGSAPNLILHTHRNLLPRWFRIRLRLDRTNTRTQLFCRLERYLDHLAGPPRGRLSRGIPRNSPHPRARPVCRTAHRGMAGYYQGNDQNSSIGYPYIIITYPLLYATL